MQCHSGFVQPIRLSCLHDSQPPYRFQFSPHRQYNDLTLLGGVAWRSSSLRRITRKPTSCGLSSNHADKYLSNPRSHLHGRSPNGSRKTTSVPMVAPGMDGLLSKRQASLRMLRLSSQVLALQVRPQISGDPPDDLTARDKVFQRRKEQLFLRFRGGLRETIFPILIRKYGCTERALDKDWACRDEWQFSAINLEKVGQD